MVVQIIIFSRRIFVKIKKHNSSVITFFGKLFFDNEILLFKSKTNYTYTFFNYNNLSNNPTQNIYCKYFLSFFRLLYKRSHCFIAQQSRSSVYIFFKKCKFMAVYDTLIILLDKSFVLLE